MAGSTSEDEFIIEDSDVSPLSEGVSPQNGRGDKDIVDLDSDSEPVESSHNKVSSVPWGRNVEELPGTMEAYAAAKELQNQLRADQRQRTFIKVLSTSSSQGNLMPFPTDFARNFMPLGRSTVTLIDETGRSWVARWSWKPGQIHPGLNAKWKPFATHHQLTRGDVVLIHLFEPAMMKFKVHIFKRKTHGPSTKKRSSSQDWEVGSVSKPRLSSAGKETIKDSEDESSDTFEMLDNDEDDKARIKLLVRRCRPSGGAEKLKVEVTLHSPKLDDLRKMLLASPNSTVQRSDPGGSFQAVVGKKELMKSLKLAFPLTDSHFN